MWPHSRCGSPNLYDIVPPWAGPPEIPQTKKQAQVAMCLSTRQGEHLPLSALTSSLLLPLKLRFGGTPPPAWLISTVYFLQIELLLDGQFFSFYPSNFTHLPTF